jgi:hypothetical protein
MIYVRAGTYSLTTNIKVIPLPRYMSNSYESEKVIANNQNLHHTLLDIIHLV